MFTMRKLNLSPPLGLVKIIDNHVSVPKERKETENSELDHEPRDEKKKSFSKKS